MHQNPENNKKAALKDAEAKRLLETFDIALVLEQLLDDFRGEKAVDRDALIQTLLGLSRIGTEHPEISEIDLNPLLVTPQGRVQAVDALVLTGGRPACV